MPVCTSILINSLERNNYNVDITKKDDDDGGFFSVLLMEICITYLNNLVSYRGKKNMHWEELQKTLWGSRKDHHERKYWTHLKCSANNDKEWHNNSGSVLKSFQAGKNL